MPRTRFADERSRSGTATFSELARKHFPERRWLIHGLLPCVGVTMIMSPEKVGKSTFVMNMIIDAALERPMLGTDYTAPRMNALYLDLDNASEELAAERILAICGTDAPPVNVDHRTQFACVTEGAEEQLHEYFTHHSVDFVIVDTLATVTPERFHGHKYQEHVLMLKKLRDVIMQYDAAMIVVHHTNKGQHDDWVRRSMGSAGIAASCDTIIGLERARGTDEGIVRSTGRYTDESEWRFQYHCDSKRITLHSIPELVRDMSEARRMIYDAISTCEEPMTAREVAELLDKPTGNVRRLMANMEADGQLLRVEKGKYVDRIS